LNNWLERLRKERGETQDQWAKAMGVSQKQVHRWEKKGGEPTIDQLKGLAGYMNTTLLAVLGEADAPLSKPPSTESEQRLACIVAIIDTPTELLAAVQCAIEETIRHGLKSAVDDTKGAVTG
jgi:transcriptional regulator with XRE-family HTH domain